MTLQLVGAGLGRTGTLSLKNALEELLGGRCYHMIEVFGNPDHIPVWHLAMQGQAVDWPALFAGHVATVDWPGAACWEEIAGAFPDAPVLLSTRESPEAWWRSASATIFPAIGQTPAEENAEWHSMVQDMLGKRFTTRWEDADEAMAAYERHNAAVREKVAPERLVEWQPGDGWEPLCRALNVGVPDKPFPHLNTSEEFNRRTEGS